MSRRWFAVPFLPLVFLSVLGSKAQADLYVSSLSNNAVLQYNGTTGAFVKTFASGGGLIAPAGLVFGPNGDLFVSSTTSVVPPSPVLEYNGTTGAFVKTFVTPGSGGLSIPAGLVFGPNGDLFVSSDGLPFGKVLEYNGTTGAFVKTFVTPGSGGLVGARGLVFGPNGNLFVSSNESPFGKVLEYDGTTGAFVKTFASGGELRVPTYLTFGPDASPTVPEVPEPASLLLWGLATLGGFGVAVRKGVSPHAARCTLKP